MKTRYILLLLAAALLIQGVCALTGDEIDITHDRAWITAGTTDKATLTVTVNNASVLVTGVAFSVESGYASAATFGTTQKVSDTVYRTTFWSTKSGSPTITASVAYSVEGVPQTPVSKSFLQNVDHAAVYDWQRINFEPEVTVFAPTPVSVKLKDRYGNTIDSRREDAEGGTAETIRFSTYHLNAGFWNNVDFNQQTIDVPVNASGVALVMFRPASTAGYNPIDIAPPLALSSKMISILGIGEVVPATITATVYPSSRLVPADGTSKFTINYILKDQYGNLCPNSTIVVTTSLGEQYTPKSNEYGQVTVLYGPRTTLATVTMDAESTLPPYVEASPLVLRFISEEGSYMFVTASPTNMASFDVLPFTRGELRARVVDLLGRGVEGEAVSFNVAGDVQSNTPLTTQPKISLTQDSANEADWVSSISNVITNEEGYAIVYFRPGGFPKIGEDYYEPFAIGNCTVEATWEGVTESSQLITWRNYPYLRVETEVSNSTVRAGETFDVTIRLIGDGHELEFREPVDVVLMTSRARSMLGDEPDDRMVEAFRAQEAFLSVFEGSTPYGNWRDRFAIGSFSEPGWAGIDNETPNTKKWPGLDNTEKDNSEYILNHYNTTSRYYDDYATIDLGLNNNKTINQIMEIVDDTVPFASSADDRVTSPLRYALYKGIKELRDNPNSNARAVRAVVVLLDQDFTLYGDPMATYGNQVKYDNIDVGTGQVPGLWYALDGLSDYPVPANYDSAKSYQNMTYYAIEDDIMIFLVSCGDVQSGIYDDLNKIPKGTGGSHIPAGNTDNLTAVFEDIARRLIRHAGVNTTMSLQFVEFADPENAMNWTASELLDYIPAEPVSTSERFFNWSASPYTPLTTPTTTWYDQSDDWYDDYSLHFEPGNIAVKQTWETVFRMRVNENVTDTLNFSVFGPMSRLYFENQDGEQSSITLPDLIVTVVPGITPLAQPTHHITVSNLSIIDGDSEYLWFGWDLNYTGEQQIRETFEYRSEFGNWNRVRSVTLSPSTTHNSLILPISNLPKGVYYFRVSASTPDAGVARDATVYDLGAGSGLYYIRIE